MKSLLFTFIFILFFACNFSGQKKSDLATKIVFQQQDKEILEQALEIFTDEKDTPISVLMLKIGTLFKETPYVASTLEIEPEQLVVNLREFDCTTFAENCLAISKTIKSKNSSFGKFTNELQKIRYRNGELNTYTSRLHYFSDWIFDNNQKQITKSVSQEIANIPYPNQINFMSTHPGSYRQLKDNNKFMKIIANQEIEISERETYFIPESNIAEFENKLMDGDIVGITTNIKGLDISHVGILIRKAGRIHLMHASSLAEKVIVSEETLEDYLLNSKSATGIMVARPLSKVQLFK